MIMYEMEFGGGIKIEAQENKILCLEANIRDSLDISLSRLSSRARESTCKRH